MAQAPIDGAESNRYGPIDSSVNPFELMVDEMREETLQTESQEGYKNNMLNSFCDICFVFNLSKIAAVYICYICKKYVCYKCYGKHDKVHNLVKLESKGSERESKRREFLREMRNESKRKERLEREKVCIVDRLNVNHDLDPNNKCWITGLCGLKNTRWVVSDHQNYCIKIFSVGSNILQRYLRFGAKPWDVTEITIKREPTEQDVISASDISVTNRAEPDKQCLLAVTIPELHSIWIIDVTQNPAAKTNSIETRKFCYSIDFREDKIFTLCSKYGFYYRGSWFLSVMSTDGVTIKTIKTDIDTTYVPYLTAFHERVFITDWQNNKVICMNNDGKVVSHKTIQGSSPFGITKDPENNKVYICAWGHGKLYRLDSSLESFEYALDLKSVQLKRPETLCFHRGKLYFGHDSKYLHRNFVNVVRVL